MKYERVDTRRSLLETPDLSDPRDTIIVAQYIDVYLECQTYISRASPETSLLPSTNRSPIRKSCARKTQNTEAPHHKMSGWRMSFEACKTSVSVALKFARGGGVLLQTSRGKLT
ncbi:unnamed protein product [Kuraishia capsulata CBS 1993]|uniref:Uncharacterized protein n=1 Tax=Kuraishia capsulata CBS 1993 TaxID=1382522 RepID=W6MI86_9ASCO|nr:uncharacterized protein KUCA_T00001573001 [Kuraishia capsulata CBS 1993]CDK25603.1 unnamed protein product [Kuraishia capsulata CBS 1993]